MAIQEFTKTDRFETYLALSMTMSMSGHLFNGSAMETDDTCGNCDGGKCDLCHPIYAVNLEILRPTEITGEYFDELKPIECRTFENEADALDHYEWLALTWITKKEEPCE